MDRWQYCECGFLFIFQHCARTVPHIHKRQCIALLLSHLPWITFNHLHTYTYIWAIKLSSKTIHKAWVYSSLLEVRNFQSISSLFFFFSFSSPSSRVVSPSNHLENPIANNWCNSHQTVSSNNQSGNSRQRQHTAAKNIWYLTSFWLYSFV